MTNNDELRIAAAQYVLDAIPSWELAHLANRLVDAGLTVRPVVDLAMLGGPTMAEAGPLFERVLESEHVIRPSRDEAAWTLLRHQVGAIASGSVAPRDNLAPMMNLYYHADIASQSCEYAGDSLGLQHLVGAYWSYDDIDDAARVVKFTGADEQRELLNAEVVQRAQEWMARHEELG